jgi:hypothetical protein
MLQSTIYNRLIFKRSKLDDMVRKELQKEHIDKLKKMREKKLQEKIQEKIKYNPKEIEKSFQRDTRKKRLDLKSREEEYEKELESIEKNLEKRKLQIEAVEEVLTKFPMVYFHLLSFEFNFYRKFFQKGKYATNIREKVYGRFKKSRH